MFRQFFPHRGISGLHWTDRVLTGVRLLVLLVLLFLGTRVGWAVIGPAWFSDGWFGRTTGAIVGILLGLLLWLMNDTASWTSGMRQESYERDRAAARDAQRTAVLARPVSPARSTPPAPRSGRAPAGNERGQGARPGGNGPARQQAGRRAAALNGAPTAVSDDAPADRRIDPALCDAIVKVVTATGHRGATAQDIGDRLPGLGFDPTREELSAHRARAMNQYRVTSAHADSPGTETRYYAPAQLKVTDDLVGQVVQVIAAAGSDPVDAAAIEAGLRRLGAEPAAPLLARVLRILTLDGTVVEAFGGYVLSTTESRP